MCWYEPGPGVFLALNASRVDVPNPKLGPAGLASPWEGSCAPAPGLALEAVAPKLCEELGLSMTLLSPPMEKRGAAR
jgi:hypothetical protein